MRWVDGEVMVVDKASIFHLDIFVIFQFSNHWDGWSNCTLWRQVKWVDGETVLYWVVGQTVLYGSG